MILYFQFFYIINYIISYIISYKMDYKQKYLKYKHKYILLKNKINNIGGVVPDLETKLIDCYIVSSHNTYLEGNQLTGGTSIDCYLNFIKKYGGGCVEMDILNIKKYEGIDDVRIGHTKTFTGVLYLRKILQGIVKILNDPRITKHGPIILSFDNKDITSYSDHQKIWDILIKELGDHLDNNFDKLEDRKIDEHIKGKVLIKWPENDEEICKCTGDACLKCTGKPLIKPDSSKNIVIREHWTHMNKSNIESISTPYKINNFENLKKNIIETNKKFIRTFPPGRNFLSGNYPFMNSVINGAQLVALNIQTQDVHTMFQMEFFKKGCLRKKPQWILDIKDTTTLTKIPTKNCVITFSENFKNIKIYKDDSNKKIDASGNKFSIDVIDGFEIIYVKCIINKQKYKGAITLTDNINKLYNIDDYKNNTCGWFINIEKSLEIKSEITNTDTDTKIEIKIKTK